MRVDEEDLRNCRVIGEGQNVLENQELMQTAYKGKLYLAATHGGIKVVDISDMNIEMDFK